MGTHPIFESDFDCLTESSMFSALGSAIDGMLGEAFRDGIRTGANEIRNEARRARDEARRAAQRDRAEARAQHERHHRNSHNRNSQNQYRPNSSRPSRNTNQRAGIPSIDEIIGDAFGSFDELFRNHQNTHNHFHQQATNGDGGSRSHGSGVFVNGQRVNPDSNGTYHYEHSTSHRNTHAHNSSTENSSSNSEGLTDAEIKRFRRHQFTKDEGVCSICMEDYIIEYTVRTLPCKHYFHVNCIDPWLRRNASCPDCRHKLK